MSRESQPVSPHYGTTECSYQSHIKRRQPPVGRQTVNHYLNHYHAPPMHMQLHEPVLATGKAITLQKDAQVVYSSLAAVELPINLVVSYDDVADDVYEWLVKLPVSAIGLDFCGVPGAAHGCATAQLIAKHGFPKVRDGCEACKPPLGVHALN